MYSKVILIMQIMQNEIC